MGKNRRNIDKFCCTFKIKFSIIIQAKEWKRMDFLMFLLGLCPILWMIIALCGFKMAGYKASFVAMIVAGILAMAVWKLPALDTATAALEGFAMALWPIILVIIAAVFTYNLSLYTGKMDVIKQMITSVSSDKRILVLLIGWCFGGFMEGMAGFGTAIAIPAGMLAGLGFSPLLSCLVCLVANGTPTPFGSIGIPTVTLANLVGLDSATLAFTQMLQLAPLMLLSPFLMVIITGKGVKALKGVFGITLISALSYVLPAILVSYFVGSELTVVVGSICSLLATIAAAMFHEKRTQTPQEYVMSVEHKTSIHVKDALVAWAPFILVFIFLLSTSKLVAPVNAFLNQFASSVMIYTGEGAAPYTFTWINTPGVWIFLSAFIGGLIQRATLRGLAHVLRATLIQMSKTMITMLCVLATAKIMGYSGMIASIANMFVMTLGVFYPIAAPLIGGLGTFVTGSGTSSSVLFGNVQLQAANAIGANPYWMVALNSLGVAVGKMMAPQSLAIGLVAVNESGKDGELLKRVFPYALGYLIIMAFIAYFGLNLFTMLQIAG